MGDHSDGLIMSHAHDLAAIYDLENASLGPGCSVGSLIENPPHLAITFRRTVGVFASENARSTDYGCGAGQSVQLIRPNGNVVPPFGTETPGDEIAQCFTRNAMDSLFSQANPKITWTYYAAGQSSLWVAPNSLSNLCIPLNGVCTGPVWVKGASNGYVDTAPPDVLNDIANCTLSQVSCATGWRRIE